MAAPDSNELPNVLCCSYPGAGTHIIASLVENVIRHAIRQQMSTCAQNTTCEHSGGIHHELRPASTHLKCDMLPESAKVIYLYRDPRDMAVAQWQSSNDGDASSNRIAWPKFLDQYLENGGQFGLWSDHFLSCQQAKKARGGVLALHFETAIEDAPSAVKQIADLLGLCIDEQEIENLAADFICTANATAARDVDFIPVDGWKVKFTISESDLFDKALKSERMRLGLEMPYWPYAEETPTDFDAVIPVYEYQGIVFPRPSVPIDRLKSVNTYEDIREDDTFVWTYPKAGTHWVMDIVDKIQWNLERQQRTHFNTEHILLELTPTVSPQERSKVPQDLNDLSKCPSPRAIGTHLPFRMLPKKVQRGKAKLIYVYRDPRDIAVSMFYMIKGRLRGDPLWTWSRYFQMFLNGKVPFGSWWEHFHMFQQKKNLPFILTLMYEDMKQDLHGAVRKISKFLGKELSETRIDEIARACSIEETQKAKPNSIFVRKGTVGDWKNHFTDSEQKQFEEKLKQVKASFSLDIPY